MISPHRLRIPRWDGDMPVPLRRLPGARREVKALTCPGRRGSWPVRVVVRTAPRPGVRPGVGGPAPGPGGGARTGA